MRLAPGIALCSLLAATGCATVKPSADSPYTEVRLRDASDDLDADSLALAAARTVKALRYDENERGRFEIGGRSFTTNDLWATARHVIEVARIADHAGLAARLQRDCHFFAAKDAAKVTAYYEPVVEGRLAADARFRYPLYAPPSAEQLAAVAARLGRAPTRRDIEEGSALGGMALEVAWLDDPVSRFFLQIQGSGRLALEDGRERRIAFAGTNDAEYVSVGRIMLERGLLEAGAATAEDMKAWMRAHPAEARELMNANPRYVYFRLGPERSSLDDDGPAGALGASLVAGRSVAVDFDFIPRGALLFLRTEEPVLDAEGRATGKRPLARFAFAQDTGAAIRGPARIDLFAGGDETGRLAGSMNEAGEVYVVVCAHREQDRWIPDWGHRRWWPVGPRPGVSVRSNRRAN